MIILLFYSSIQIEIMRNEDFISCYFSGIDYNLNMKSFLFIFLLYLISFSVLSQKVTIKVSKTKNSGLATWQIIDDQNTTVFSGIEDLQDDTVTFSLNANKRYF